MMAKKAIVQDRRTLDELYAGSALTFIGQSDEDGNVKDIFDWIEGHTPLKRREVYVIKGELMNREYGLTGDNAYWPGLTLLCFRLDDMETPMKLAIPRLQVGGWWFDDVVDSNACKQARIDGRAED